MSSTSEEEPPQISIVREPYTEPMFLPTDEEEDDDPYFDVDLGLDQVEPVFDLGLKKSEPANEVEAIDVSAVVESNEEFSPTPTTETPSESSSQPNGLLLRVKAGLFRKLNNGKFAFASKGRNDGVGAQALGKITALVMARALDMQYAHFPFTHLEHADAKMKQSQFAEEWEDLLCIGGDHIKLTRFPHIRTMPHESLHQQLQSFQFKTGWAYVVRDAHTFTNFFRNELRDEWRTTIEELRLRYRGFPGESFRRTSTSGTATVAVHIRRGDALERGSTEASKRVSENAYFAGVMRALQRQASKAHIHLQFHIVSEGVPKDFADLTQEFPEAELHLSTPSPNINHRGAQSTRAARAPRNQHLMNRRMNGAALQKMERVRQRQGKTVADEGPTAAEAFKMLVGADMLVMSKSSFSVLAGLYSQGIKIAPPDLWFDIPLWCEEEDHWFSCNGGEIQHADRLEREITARSF